MAPTEEQKKEVEEEKRKAEEDAKRIDRDLHMNGFVSFANMDAVLKWNAKDADTMHRGNTPLYKRVVSDDLPKPKLFLMHDYRSNYLNYERAQGATQPHKDYVMEYWQHVEVFNYFSHRRVTIPPPAWINAGHRNGALVLGTFIIEPGSRDDPILIFNEISSPDKSPQVQSSDKFIVPDILAEMARVYGFDGWLLNFESTIVDGLDIDKDANGNKIDRPPQWPGFSGTLLAEWIKQLRTKLISKVPDGRIIWYDALTATNWDPNTWQNELNEVNEPFYKAAGFISTNYNYDDNKLNDTFDFAGKDLDTVYHGLDCWGQTNDSNELKKDGSGEFEDRDWRNGTGSAENGQLESSWGPGHGGMATGLFVHFIEQKLAIAKAKTASDMTKTPHGASVGLFAQGWAYEHFRPGTAADRFMWEGLPNLTPWINKWGGTDNSPRLTEKDWESKQDKRKKSKDFNWQAEYDCPCKKSLAAHLWKKAPREQKDLWTKESRIEDARPDFHDWPIVKSAQEYPAGTATFFHTDYMAPVWESGDHQGYHYQIARQSVLPRPALRQSKMKFQDAGNTTADLHAVMSKKCRLTVAFKKTELKNTSNASASLLLHRLHIAGSAKPTLTIAFNGLKDTSGISIKLVGWIGGAKVSLVDLAGKPSGSSSSQPITQPILFKNTQDVLTEIWIELEAPGNALANLAEKNIANLIDISSITIKPADHTYPSGTIKTVELSKTTTKYATYTRLAWTLNAVPAADKAKAGDMPWSLTTNQFSHFFVEVNKVYLGVAYTLAFAVDDEQMKAWPKDKVPVKITGITFDGASQLLWEGEVNLK